ncbi:hypothetical protein GCM10027422_17410 [Hymenobacter arcticus]
MQINLLYLRLTEDWRSPLAPAEVLLRVQQVTAPSFALGRPVPREPAPLFQGWTKTDSFRISLFHEFSSGLFVGVRRRRNQTSVVVDGQVMAHSAGGSQLQLRYRPLLVQLLILGFWLFFGSTLVLVSLLEYLRGPQASFSWWPTGVVCAFYGLAVLSFWKDTRRSWRRLVPSLSLVPPDAPPIF